MRRIFNIVPLMAIPVGLYVTLAVLSGGMRGADVFIRDLEAGQFPVPLPSGSVWMVSGGDMLVAFGLVILFYELIRGVGVGRYAMLHHTFSVVLTLFCFGGFVVFPTFATTTFFLLALMCLLDVIGGILVDMANSGADGPGRDEDDEW